MKKNDFVRVEKAIRFIEDHFQEQPGLDEIARSAQLSPFHFQKLFQRWAGVSPKRFLQFLTVEYAKQRLAKSRSVMDAAYDAGLSGPSRLHDLFVSVEAMTPGEYKSGGKGLRIEYGIHESPFGPALAAITPRGLCGFSFLGNHSPKQAFKELKGNWPQADFVDRPSAIRGTVNRIFEKPPGHSGEALPILLKGTSFQLKVWEALLKIPMGSVASYRDVARMIRKPRASRAVGTAVGQNQIAFLIPCHRVIRETGVLGNYKWGTVRKKAILAWEESRDYASRPLNSARESTSPSMNSG